ncbi:MAG: creatininase family protein [Firmicutes bacterium]|nr:creatininase family protein [Bacillota bacterium]MBQ2455240.1 creatininase family protein [Bacillota bacterium]MBQ4180878.1 creatininase family protein [Bacillota bacterium]MBQ6260551.1 creatininase family protein [Bacillota bacterium]
MFLERMTWKQAGEFLKKDPVCVIPIGSTEQHGPQCALGTDFLVPRNLAERLDKMIGEDIVIVPTIPYGVCEYHMSFPGTINIGLDGLQLVLGRVASAMMSHGLKRFVVINGHGGNTPAIQKVSLDVYHAGGIMASVDWWSLVGQLDDRFKAGGHGDRIETSAMMAVCPEAVDLSLCMPMNPGQPTEKISAKYIQVISFSGGTVGLTRDTKELAPSGWFGPYDPKDATAEEGEDMLNIAAGYIKDFIPEFRKIALPEK